MFLIFPADSSQFEFDLACSTPASLTLAPGEPFEAAADHVSTKDVESGAEKGLPVCHLTCHHFGSLGSRKGKAEAPSFFFYHVFWAWFDLGT